MKKSALLFLSLIIALVLPARANDAARQKTLIERVETCEAILQQFMGRPETAIPKEVLAKAKALVIVNQFKAGAIFGIQDGYGVILVKRANGRWSVPALLTSAEASLGFQLGANKIEMIYIITDEQTPHLLFNRRVNFGLDAKAVAGPRFSETQKLNKNFIETSPVLIYSKKAGLFAGATVKTGYLKRDDAANRILYSTNYTFPEILYSEWVKPIPEVTPLMEMVQKIAP